MGNNARTQKKYRSVMHYVLSSLAPYTEANLKLSFMPAAFFKDISKLSQAKTTAIRSAYYRALKEQLIEIDAQNIPRLTKKGVQKIKPYEAKKLKGAYLMVVYDIPEADRWKRQRLYLLLRELSFKQVQKSVWISPYDHRDYLQAEIKESSLKGCVRVFESRELRY